MLVLQMICRQPTYGYELLTRLKNQSNGMFILKEGTLYPILYRLEDEGLICASWSQGEGKTAPKKIYEATESGFAENVRRQTLWLAFKDTVNGCLKINIAELLNLCYNIAQVLYNKYKEVRL